MGSLVDSLPTYQLSNYVAADALQGYHPTEEHFDVLLRDSVRVVGPDGGLVAVYLRGVVPQALAVDAFDVLKKAELSSRNRGISTHAGEQHRIVNPNGTRSKTNQLAEPVNSGIIGYYDRYTRTPYCRECAWNRNHPDAWRRLYPYIAFVDRVFAEYAPDHHRRQLEFARRTDPAWVIGDTAFTTVSVNKTYQTAVHKDGGDLREGFGVISSLRAGEYSGGYLVLPEYRIAFDLRSCDVILFDVHRWHGNTALTLTPGALRITLVLYYRENMIRCGGAEYELNRVQNRKLGDPLWGAEEIRRGDALATEALVAAARSS